MALKCRDAACRVIGGERQTPERDTSRPYIIQTKPIVFLCFYVF